MAYATMPSSAVPKDGVADELLNFANALMTNFPGTPWENDSYLRGIIEELTAYRTRYQSNKTAVDTALGDYRTAKEMLEALKKVLDSKKSDMYDSRTGMYARTEEFLSKVTVDPNALSQVAATFGWTGGQYSFEGPEQPVVLQATYANGRLFINWKDTGAALYYVVLDNKILTATALTEVWLRIAQYPDVNWAGNHSLVIRAQNDAGTTNSDPQLVNIA